MTIPIAWAVAALIAGCLWTAGCIVLGQWLRHQAERGRAPSLAELVRPSPPAPTVRSPEPKPSPPGVSVTGGGQKGTRR